MTDIVYLADHPEAVPTLARWFRAQWSVYFAGKSQAEVVASFHAEMNRTRIPARLLAYVNGTLAGTIVLRELAMGSEPDTHPGLGGLYVTEEYRRRGVGTTLLTAGMDLACELGFETLYAGTATAQHLFERLEWLALKTIREGCEQVVLYSYILG